MGIFEHVVSGIGTLRPYVPANVPLNDEAGRVVPALISYVERLPANQVSLHKE